MYQSGQLPMSMDYLPNDLSGCRPVIKPTRPLTSYHLYFQLEREHLIQTTKSTDVDDDEVVTRFLDGLAKKWHQRLICPSAQKAKD